MSKTDRTWSLTLLAAGLALLSASGCYRRLPAVQGYVASQMQAITAGSRPQAAGPLQADNGPVELVGCAGETLGFQIVLDAARGGAVQLEWPGLVSDQGVPLAGDVEVFRALPVRVGQVDDWHVRLFGPEAPGGMEVFDAMLPLSSGQATQLRRGQRLVFWIDVPLARDAMPGVYRGQINLASRQRRIWSTEVYVRVLDAVLPELPVLSAVAGFEHSQVFRAFLRRGDQPYDPVRLDRSQELVRQGLVLVRRLMQLGRRHRMDLFDAGLRPVLKRDRLGRIRLEWDDYDAIARPYLDGSAFEDGRPVAAWPMPVSEDSPGSAPYGGFGSPEHRAVLEQVLGLYAEHFAAMDCARGRVFLWPMRQGPGDQAYAQIEMLAALAQAQAPAFPLLAQLPPSPPPATLWPNLSGRMAMAVPPGMFFAPGGQEIPGAPPLAGLWLWPGAPPAMPALGLLEDGASVRALPLLAYQYAARGLFVPRAFDWSGDPFSVASGSPPQLFYPYSESGQPALLASAQLKRLRRGLEDLGYLQLLKVRGRQVIADEVAGTLARYAGQAGTVDNYLDSRLHGWAREPAIWEAAHRLLAYELWAAVQQGDDDEGLRRARLQWLNQVRAAAQVRVERVRTLVREAPAGRRTIDVELDLYNERPRAAAVLVEFAALPPPWQARKQTHRVANLAPASAAKAHLQAEFAEFPYTDDGKVLLLVSVQAEPERARTFEAAACLVRVAWTQRPPAIDGSLDDWTPHAGNAAGDFRALARADGELSQPARQQTRVYLLRDAGRLYVAVRCFQADLSRLRSRPDNLVRYEGLAAWGEDMVEVVLDPGRRAEGPEGLYHLVVKANGIVRARRGIDRQPPLGRASPWPAEIASAVGRSAGEWVVELAIPLSALGPGGQERTWGVNFARFCTADQESSNWAHANRNLYDPQSLGLLELAGPPAGP
jgi:hypothetical protein